LDLTPAAGAGGANGLGGPVAFVANGTWAQPRRDCRWRGRGGVVSKNWGKASGIRCGFRSSGGGWWRITPAAGIVAADARRLVIGLAGGNLCYFIGGMTRVEGGLGMRTALGRCRRPYRRRADTIGAAGFDGGVFRATKCVKSDIYLGPRQSRLGGRGGGDGHWGQVGNQLGSAWLARRWAVAL